MDTKPPDMAETFAIYVGFDQIKDPKERQDFLNLPTTFALPKEEVDKIRKIGPGILDESEGYRKLCAELKCQGK
jgi:NTE family protein